MDFDPEASFRDQLYKSYETSKRVLLPKEEYQKIINEILESNSTSKKSPHQYYLLKKYEVLECGDVRKLIRKREQAEEDPVYFATGHGGRDKMIKETSKKYDNITQEALNLFKSACLQCRKKRKRTTTKGVVVKPIMSKDFNSRAQVDLIDMQAMCQGQFKWIMNYQDHLTKFCILRPLSSKRASEVAYQLLDIFLLFGAPAILQSDNGSEFTAQVINELKLLWPDLVIVHGKPRHPQSQGSVERANCDVKDMLVAWLDDNKTTDWPIGLKFVQFQKNSSHHSGIKRSPFAALLGADAKVGLTSSSLPQEVISRLQSEDDLLNAISPTTRELPDSEEPTPEQTAETTPEDDIATITSRQDTISTQRKRAADSQLQQAEKMVKRSKIVLSEVKVGDNVTVPIPAVDRGRSDPRNLLGVVKEISDNDMYTIVVKAGTLNHKYSRNQFDLCATFLYTLDDMTSDTMISLRTAVQKESNCGGQGFVRCNCAGTKRCQSNRCKCFKARLLCNSRCHSSLSCSNKNCC